MLPGMELMGCQDLAVPADVMHHVVRVESSYNPYAIGVVGGKLARQPASQSEAVATARMLERKGYNFSLGLAQVNRHNLEKYGLDSYERAFQVCPNLQAGAKILAECYGRSGNDWGKSFSCYYSGDFVTGFRHGYVQKVYASMRTKQGTAAHGETAAIAVAGTPNARPTHGRERPRRISRISSGIAAAASVAAIAPAAPLAIDAAQAAPLVALPTGPLVAAQPARSPSPPVAVQATDAAFVF